MDSLGKGEPSLAENKMMSTGEVAVVVSDDELNEHICLLESKQREVFDTVYPLSISYMKNLMTQNITAAQPLDLFITGNFGYFKKKFLAPASAAAVNIDGTTILGGTFQA